MVVNMSDSSFGHWLKQQRLKVGLSQKKVCELSNGKIKQATLSSYESNNVQDFSLIKIITICKVLNIPRREIPWHLIQDNEEDSAHRIGIRALTEEASSVRLFNGKTYEVEGELVKSLENGEVKAISEIYYQVRSVMKEGTQIAKRKHPKDELCIAPIKYGWTQSISEL